MIFCIHVHVDFSLNYAFAFAFVILKVINSEIILFRFALISVSMVHPGKVKKTKGVSIIFRQLIWKTL